MIKGLKSKENKLNCILLQIQNKQTKQQLDFLHQNT